MRGVFEPAAPAALAALTLFALSIASAAPSASAAAEGTSGPEEWRKAIVRVAERTIPAVVHVEVVERGLSRKAPRPPADRPSAGLEGKVRRFKQERRGLGSGMIMDEA